MVQRLWPFIEALASALMENRSMAGETAVFMALAGVFGFEEAAARLERRPLRLAFDDTPHPPPPGRGEESVEKPPPGRGEDMRP